MTTNLTDYDHDIFLSYNKADEEWTAKLAARLEQEDWPGRKLKVFFAPWDIRPGQSIPLEIERAIPKSRKVGIVLSPESTASAWVELERMVTTYIAVTAREDRLIPLLREACDVPSLLRPILSIDFTDDSRFEVSYQTLLAVIKDEPLPRVSGTSPGKTVSAAPPIPRPPFVGFVARRDEQGHDIVQLLKEQLAPGVNQLVTLSGPGGVGKTTLAAEAARALKAAYGGRLVWSETAARAGYTLPTLLDDAATQLGRPDLRMLKPDEKEAAVRVLVADPPALIVLDNYETITTDERRRIGEWFEGAQCSALFTSRQHIRKTFSVNILVMQRDEAEELLEKLIAQTQDPQMFSADVRQHIYETAEANPFLMEWVVAQINEAQEPRTVLDELQHGEGDAAERVFDRSFNLPQLGDDGRAALLALSLFTPSASREALAKVAGFGDDQKRLNEAVRSLHALWLIKAIDQNRRLTVEGLTRSLAAARLSKDSSDNEFHQRFVAYFLRYAEAYAQPTPEDYEAQESEKDNLLSATETAFALEDWRSVVRMAYPLANPIAGMLYVRGYWDEAFRVGDLALKAARASQVEDLIAEMAHNVGVIYQNRGEIDEARRLYEESLEIAKKIGYQSGIATATSQLGEVHLELGEFAESKVKHEESLAIRQRIGDGIGVAIDLHQLGMIAHNTGEFDEARRLYGESLEINRTLGNQSSISITLHQLAILAQIQGDLDEARRLYGESLEIARRLGNLDGIANTLGRLGLLAESQGDASEAARLYREALSIFERLKSPNADVARQFLARVVDASS